MIRPFASLSRRRSVRVALVAGVAAVAALALALAGAAGPHGAVPPPPAKPTSADQIQNIDQVKTAIKAYYGDTHDSTRCQPGGPERRPLHQPSPRPAPTPTRWRASSATPGSSWPEAEARRPAEEQGRARRSLFDIDDTTLNTYSYEIFSNFVFNPTTNATFVNAGRGLPGRAGHGRPRGQGRDEGLHGVLPDRAARGAARGTLRPT